MAEIILVVIFIIIVWALFYFVAHVLGDNYDKKPLKYAEVKKVENNNIKNNKPMENKEEKQLTPIKKNWYAPYITGGLIYAVGFKIFGSTLAGQFSLSVFSIAAMFFYYPLKSKIKIKNGALRIIATFFILEIIAALLVGFSTGLVNGLIGRSINQEKLSFCQGVCNFSPATKVWTFNELFADHNDPMYIKYGAKKYVPTKYFQTQDQCLNYCLTQ